MIKTFENNAHNIIFVVISRAENAWTLNASMNKVALGEMWVPCDKNPSIISFCGY